MTVHIDETPPSLSFAAQNPADPTGVVVDASDTESGVADGSIEMSPVGTKQWTNLPTTFAGGQLVAHFDDAGLRGQYSFNVRACDNVGNCASATRTLMLPVRIAGGLGSEPRAGVHDRMRQPRRSNTLLRHPPPRPRASRRAIWPRLKHLV